MSECTFELLISANASLFWLVPTLALSEDYDTLPIFHSIQSMLESTNFEMLLHGRDVGPPSAVLGCPCSLLGMDLIVSGTEKGSLLLWDFDTCRYDLRKVGADVIMGLALCTDYIFVHLRGIVRAFKIFLDKDETPKLSTEPVTSIECASDTFCPLKAVEIPSSSSQFFLALLGNGYPARFDFYRFQSGCVQTLGSLSVATNGHVMLLGMSFLQLVEKERFSVLCLFEDHIHIICFDMGSFSSRIFHRFSLNMDVTPVCISGMMGEMFLVAFGDGRIEKHDMNGSVEICKHDSLRTGVSQLAVIDRNTAIASCWDGVLRVYCLEPYKIVEKRKMSKGSLTGVYYWPCSSGFHVVVSSKEGIAVLPLL